MPPLIPYNWRTDPEYINLLNFLIGKTENVASPMSIQRLTRLFKEKSGTVLTANCIQQRIGRVRKIIYSFEHIDIKKKVKMLFALSVPVKPEFLKELKNDAFVEVDDKKRITHYKSNDGHLELRGDHSHSAKISTAIQESERRPLFTSYFEKKNNADAVPTNEREREMWNFIEFITEKCEKADSPLSTIRLAEDYVEKFRTSAHPVAVRSRIRRYRLEIQRMEFLDTHSKVQQLFGLSVTVNSDCLEKFRKNAQVEVDERNRIVLYKANDGSLELRGDHSRSAKISTAKQESKRSFRSLMNNYLKKKNDADAIPPSEKEEAMRNFIEFITEKCENADSPLSIIRLAKDFIQHFGKSVPLDTIRGRIKRYRDKIQKTEFLDTPSKVKQLFGLRASLNSNFLKELRKDAVVEVDNLNRITNYTANNGSLTLCGDHSRSVKRKLSRIEWKRNNKKVKKHSNFGGDKNEESETENGYSEDESEEYSSEEFGSEFDSDDEDDPLDETEDLTQLSNETDDFENETPVRNRSPTGISIADNLEFDPPTKRVEDQENDHEITRNSLITTRSGRLSKRRHLDSEFSYNLANSRSLGVSMNTDSTSSKPAKQKKMKIDEVQALNSSSQSRRSSKSIKRSSRNSSFSTFSTESEENKENHDAPRAEDHPSDYNVPRIQEMEDYDYNPKEDNIHESSSIDNFLKEPEPSAAKDHNPSIKAQNTENRADAVAPEPEPVEETLTPQNNKNSTPPTNGKEVTSQEIPIKVENEEQTAIEDNPEDVKPVTAHNPKIKFFEAMKSLILFLDTPSLSNLQSKIHQKIRKMKGSKEVLLNNELIPALELLIARMTNHSVIDISKNVKTVSLIQFLCYLKASILNSKMIGVEGLMNNISELIEKSQNRRIPMEKVSKALHATLDVDSF